MKLHARSKRGLDARRDAPARDGTHDDPTRQDPPPVTPPAPAAWSRTPRTSVWAVLALITSVVAVATMLTGVLAIPAAVLGVAAIVMALIGLHAAAKLHITGGGVAVLGLVLGLVAAAVGALVVTNVVAWDASNHVTSAYSWLESNAPRLVDGSG